MATLAAIYGFTPATADPPAGLATGAWNLESLSLSDGRRLEGLVVDPGAGAPADRDPMAAIGFVQVVRPPGRPMYLITWAPISPLRIVAIERLSAAEHATLATRVEEFRSHRGRQHAAETAVKLERDGENEPWRHASRLFSLESTADPRLTRAAVVRLEQVFAALESLVPPQATEADPARQLTVTLCGTASEYRSIQASLGIRADHPAFYIPAQRRLVAGSDMPALIDQERLAADNLAVTQRQLAARDRSFEADVRGLASDLEKQNLPAGKRAEVVQLARNRWQREREATLGQITAARRENAARVEDARRDFFAWLTHEAWHAYADRRLVGSGRGTLPLWLDEGLAQVIETAPLEAGELRLDAADPVRLRALQAFLGRREPPRLLDLLTARQERFLVGHGGSREMSRHAYLMAWGLAFHLALLEPVLAPASLTALCETAEAHGDDVQRVADFERLVGMDLAKFEEVWRRRILTLRPGERVGVVPVVP